MARAEKFKEARVAATAACEALKREVEPALRAVMLSRSIGRRLS